MVDISNLIGVDPVNTISWPDAGLMLRLRQRRWANIERALGQRIVFAWRLTQYRDPKLSSPIQSGERPIFDVHKRQILTFKVIPALKEYKCF